MVVGGPNQRTDFHLDPYEEWFYQVRGNMHVNIMTTDGPRSASTSARARCGCCRGNMPHSPQRPEEGSIGLVVERIREEGTLEKFVWFCPNCNAKVHEVELQVRDIVADLPPVFASFYDDEEAPHLRRLRHPAPGQGLTMPLRPARSTSTRITCRRGGPISAAGQPWLRVDSEREADDHGRVDGVPTHPQRTAGTPTCDWPTWTPTGWRSRSSRRPRSSSRTVARPARRRRWRAIFNDLALEICAPGDGRLIPFCQVPLQDPDAACRELERSVAAGHAGVEIGNHVGERDLDDAGIVTFLQHAPRWACRSSCTRGTCRPRRDSTAGWRNG